MTHELKTRMAIGQRYASDPREEVRWLAEILRGQILASREAPDSEALRETIEMTFQRLRSLAGE